MGPSEPGAASLPYRWGKFEGRALIISGILLPVLLFAALLIRVLRAGLEGAGLDPTVLRLLVLIVGMFAVFFLMGRGLLRKRRYALRLVYLRLGLSAVLACIVVAGWAVGVRGRRESWERPGSLTRTGGSLVLSVSTARYYYRRRHEFH